MLENKQIQFAPANDAQQIKNESRVMYAVITVVLISAAAADIQGFYKSLLSSFTSEMAAAIAICLVIAFELSLSAMILGARNLFAWGKMSWQSLTFYVVLTVFAAFGSFHLGGLIMDNVHAVGVKNRSFTNSVKYQDDPVLQAARIRVSEVSKMLEQTEATMASIAAPMREAGFAASGFSKRAGDTTLSVNARRDQLWNATRAGKTQASLGSALLDASKEKSRLLTEKLRAQDALDSLTVALDLRYRHKSPEDFAEATIGRNLLADISSATVWASLLAISALVMVRAYASGTIQYRALEYKPAGSAPPSAAAGEQTSRVIGESVGAGESNTAAAVATWPVPSDVILPERDLDESRSDYERRVGELYLKGGFEKATQKSVARKMGLTEVEMTRLLKKIRGSKELLKENQNGKSSLKSIPRETI